MAVNLRLEIRRNCPVGVLAKIFKRACGEAGIPSELKERQFFIRKTDKNRRKKALKARNAAESNNQIFKNGDDNARK